MLEIIYIHVICFLFFLVLFLTCRCLKHRQARFGLLKDCFKKMSREHNLAEAGKLSLGVYHDVCNILTASNIAWQQTKNNSYDNILVESLSSQGLEINQRIISLLKNYRRCLKGDKEPDVFDINQEIDNALSIFNFYFVNKNINLKLSLINTCLLKGNGSLFFRVFLNLLSNAVESFSEREDDREIRIKTYYRDNAFILEVSDNGCGISDKYLKKIFETFFSLKDIKSEDSKNCGLGLAVVKDIVENHLKAKIEVESTLGQGSIFRICF